MPRELESGAAEEERRPDIAASEPSTLPRAPAPLTHPTRPWLTYPEAAEYLSYTVPYLRNLVSAGQIPVYGRPRARRFRRDMLDLYLTDPNMAMRKFRAERKRPHDR